MRENEIKASQKGKCRYNFNTLIIMNANEIRIIRISLQSISSEFKNLTDKDLVDCKWLIKKRIFTELISLSNIFYDIHIKIDILNENYNKTIALNRQNKLSKDIVIENERDYKTSFINFIIVSFT